MDYFFSYHGTIKLLFRVVQMDIRPYILVVSSPEKTVYSSLKGHSIKENSITSALARRFIIQKIIMNYSA